MRIPPIVFAMSLLTTSCEKAEPDEFIDIVFDPCETIFLEVQSTFSNEQYEAVRQAGRMWNDLLGSSIGISELAANMDVYQDGDAPFSVADRTIPVVFDRAAEAFRGYYDDENGVIYINDRLAIENIAYTLAHEIGHSFGLFHIEKTNRISVMNHGNMSIAPNREDAKAVENLWGICTSRWEHVAVKPLQRSHQVD